MLRQLLKTGVACSLHWSGMDSWIGSRWTMKNMPVILGYHRVVEDFRQSCENAIPSMMISTRTFERQLDWLGRHYDFVTLDEIADWQEGNLEFDSPVAAITFDDGYRDVYQNAFPVLHRKGIPSANFIVTDLVGTTRIQNHDQLYMMFAKALKKEDFHGYLSSVCSRIGLSPLVYNLLDRYGEDAYQLTRICIEYLSQVDIQRLVNILSGDIPLYGHELEAFYAMDWREVSRMADNGVTIGSHTRTHTVLSKVPRQKIIDEVHGSCQVIEQQLGSPVRHFAYPDGQFTHNAVKVVADSGFRTAYTACLHRDREYPQLTLPRILLWEGSCLNAFGQFSPSVMGCQVNAVFNLAAGTRGNCNEHV